MDTRKTTIHILVLPYQPHPSPANPDDGITRAGRITHLNHEIAGQRSHPTATVNIRYRVISGNNAPKAAE